MHFLVYVRYVYMRIHTSRAYPGVFFSERGGQQFKIRSALSKMNTGGRVFSFSISTVLRSLFSNL